MGPAQGAPALGPDGTCYVASRNGTLYAVGPLGNQRWARPLGGSSRGSVAIGPIGVAVALDAGVVRWWGRECTPLGSIALGTTPAAGPALGPGGCAVVPTTDGQLVSTGTAGVL